jgi:hypothetical protein
MRYLQDCPHSAHERGFVISVFRSWPSWLFARLEQLVMDCDPHLYAHIKLVLQKEGEKMKCACWPALAGTSVSHCCSTSLFLPFQPQRLTHSCFSSSQTALSFFECEIPFSAANFCHLVSGLGLGRGFARGRSVVGGGSCAAGPSGDGCVGSVKRVLRRDWTPSRAVDWRYDSRSSL